jgi:hypothetical protein
MSVISDTNVSVPFAFFAMQYGSMTDPVSASVTRKYRLGSSASQSAGPSATVAAIDFDVSMTSSMFGSRILTLMAWAVALGVVARGAVIPASATNPAKVRRTKRLLED